MFGASAGRTLIEMLIALGLGMFILIAVFSLFISSKAVAHINENRARLDEDGMLALNLLAFHVRMAGYGRLQAADPGHPGAAIQNSFETAARRAGGLQAVEGCSGSFKQPRAVPFVCDESKPGDVLVVRYMVDPDNANRSVGQLPVDCLGQAIDMDPATGQAMLENRFYVARNSRSGNSELYCAGNGGLVRDSARLAASPQPLTEHVLELRVWYGYDADQDGLVDAYYSAAQLHRLDDSDSGAGSPWRQVSALRLCLLLQSADDQLLPQPQQFTDCQGQPRTAADRRLYGVFSTVVKLRSRAGGAV